MGCYEVEAVLEVGVYKMMISMPNFYSQLWRVEFAPVLAGNSSRHLIENTQYKIIK